MKNQYIQYYVEGEDEEKLINVLKTKMRLIKPAKVQKLNVIEHRITDARLRTLAPGTMVVLVFDTDTNHYDTLKYNIEKIKQSPTISDIVIIPQVPNLEGELLCSCEIKKITDLLNSKSKSDFKKDLISANNLDKKLMEHKFDINRFWINSPESTYTFIVNNANKIKLV